MTLSIAQTSSRKVIDRVEVNFDRAANYHVFYRFACTDIQAGEVHLTTTHKQVFQYLSKVEAFIFRIDPDKSPQGKKKIMQKITSMGFNIESSTQPHYQYYASR